MSTRSDHADVLGGAAPGLADEAHGVGVVDHDQRVVAFGEVADLVQRREVAVHGEDAVGDDDLAAGVRRLDAAAPRGRPCRGSRSGSRCALHSRMPSMIEAWLSSSEMTASSAPNSDLEDAAVGVEAGGVQDGVLGAEELRHAGLRAACGASWVPQMKRTLAMPKPHSSRAALARGDRRPGGRPGPGSCWRRSSGRCARPARSAGRDVADCGESMLTLVL